jgi:hypothetical protein
VKPFLFLILCLFFSAAPSALAIDTIQPSDASKHAGEEVYVEGVVASVVRGILLNDDDPYLVRATNGGIYKAEWYGGYSAWFQGDHVILTNVNGLGQMVSPDDDDKMAEVWVGEIEDD